MENVRNFFFLGSKFTADGDYSHEINIYIYLLLGGKLMTHLDTQFKIRDIVLPKKVHPYKAMVFLIVMYGCIVGL